jgi:hypothetical protein
MFSHTAKGQPYNTPLLAKFVRPADDDTWRASFPRLIDYELLTNPKDGKRTVGFGWFAGGTLSILHRPSPTLTLQPSRRGTRIPLSNGPFPSRNRDSLSVPRQSVFSYP